MMLRRIQLDSAVPTPAPALPTLATTTTILHSTRYWDLLRKRSHKCHNWTAFR